MILARFQAVGKQPVAIERLNSLVRLGAIDKAVDSSIIADTPSRPVDLPGFREFSKSVTWSSVHWFDSGHSLELIAVGGLREGNDRLKQS